MQLHNPLDTLTPAERHVAALIAEGLPPGAIAEQRACAVGTVRAQLKAIYKKLGVHRQNELSVLVNRVGRIPSRTASLRSRG